MDEHQAIDPDVIDLRDYVDVVRRQWWVVVATVVLVVGAALGYSNLQTPVYEASAEITLEPPAEGDTAEQVLFGGIDQQAQPHVITSRPVLERVMREHGLEHDDDRAVRGFANSVDVAVEGGGVFEITVRREDPAQAAAMAESFIDAYVARLQDRAEERAEEEFDELDRQEEDAIAEVRGLEAQLADTTGATRQSLEEDRDQAYARLRWIEERRIALETAMATFAPRMVDVFQPASVPDEPVSPRPARTGALALVLGGLLGVGLAFVRNWSSPRLYRATDVARVTPVPVLATLGDAAGRKADPQEDYRVLRASLRAVLHRVRLPDERGHAVQLASVETGGTESIAFNLAAAVGRTGARVLILDADLEHGGIATLVDAGGQPGLAEVLTGQATATSALQGPFGPVEILTAGNDPDNAIDAMSSPAMEEVLDELRRRADLVIVNSRPALTSAGPLELGRLVDGTVLVATSGRTSPSDLEGVLERMDQSDASVAGIILSSAHAPGAQTGPWQAAPRLGAAAPGSDAALLTDERAQSPVETDNAGR